eukprot:9321139-Alexandrium_andersonii.AAC.1
MIPGALRGRPNSPAARPPPKRARNHGPTQGQPGRSSAMGGRAHAESPQRRPAPEQRVLRSEMWRLAPSQKPDSRLQNELCFA